MSRTSSLSHPCAPWPKAPARAHAWQPVVMLANGSVRRWAATGALADARRWHDACVEPARPTNQRMIGAEALAQEHDRAAF